MRSGQERVRVGVVGLGVVAQVVHLPILQMLSDRYEIAALCDLSPGLVRELGQHYQVAERYTDLRRLTAEAEVDVVFVLSNDESHADASIAAAEAGRHVFVEKPMCLTMREAEAIIAARDRAGVQVMVGYMRRFAPAFLQAVRELATWERVNYAALRDLIGRNQLMIEQTSVVRQFDDLPDDAVRERQRRGAELVTEAIGEAPPALRSAYRLLCGLSSHDLSAMRELLGAPRRVASAVAWRDGRFLSMIFEYDDFHATLDTGVDQQRRFDASIEVHGDDRWLRVRYNTPFIRQLPTTLTLSETVGDSYRETLVRPTFTDPYACELKHLHAVLTGAAEPKTTPEDFVEDLRLFRGVIDAVRRT